MTLSPWAGLHLLRVCEQALQGWGPLSCPLSGGAGKLCHTVGLQLVGGQGEVGRREWAAVLELSTQGNFMGELHLL